jgi:hypothetical protein
LFSLLIFDFLFFVYALFDGRGEHQVLGQYATEASRHAVGGQPPAHSLALFQVWAGK